MHLPIGLTTEITTLKLCRANIDVPFIQLAQRTTP
jgi:hypothetical protein